YAEGHRYAVPFNFGPPSDEIVTVRELVNGFAKAWGGVHVQEKPDPNALHEAAYLMLDSTRARQMLQWRPSASLQQDLLDTAQWYKSFYRGADCAELRALSLDTLQARYAPAAAPPSRLSARA
ncbi:MAG TPA: hypothetical protein VHB73_02795, partial [Alphaproteobacteria bacterium]|nr:hypothetical protein [Alphaproteobacteria bacterium]